MKIRPKVLAPSAFTAVFLLAGLVWGQIPASFSPPILGYVLDTQFHAIRPLIGIPGSSRIGAPLGLDFAVDQAAFLPDQNHAIIASAGTEEVIVVDLENPSRFTPIAGVSSSLTAMRISADGTKAVFYYESRNHILVVHGLGTAPSISMSIDTGFAKSALKRFAISNDGQSALLAFSGEESDIIYRWSLASGIHRITTASNVSDLAFVNDDAVIADSGADHVLMIRNVSGQATLVRVADQGNDIAAPSAIGFSPRNEIYVGNAGNGTVVVLDNDGRLLRTLKCNCSVTDVSPLQHSVFRLTGRVDLPLFILDGRESTEQIRFVPALESAGAAP